jgi:hypothetical protein
MQTIENSVPGDYSIRLKNLKRFITLKEENI